MSEQKILFFILLLALLLIAVAVLASLVFILRAKLNIEKQRGRLWESMYIDSEKTALQIGEQISRMVGQLHESINKVIAIHESQQKSKPTGL